MSSNLDRPLAVPKIIIGKDFPKAVIEIIESAERTIDIIIYDWRLYGGQKDHPVSKFTAALETARKRGIVIRCIVANDGLMARLRDMGFKVKNLHSDRLLHAKLMLIDSERAVLGSHNYTQGAFTHNLEISLAVELGAAAAELQAYYNRLWGV